MEERVAGEQIRSDAEAHRPARVARRVHDLDVEIVPAKQLAVVQLLLAHDIGLVVRHTGKVADRLELFMVVRVERRGAIVCRFQRRHPVDVVRMSVREQDLIATQTSFLEQREVCGCCNPGSTTSASVVSRRRST